MAEFMVSVWKPDAEAVRSILDTYAPRLSYTSTPPRWWRDHVEFFVSGEQPYLGKAEAEIEDWRQDMQLRRAW